MNPHNPDGLTPSQIGVSEGWRLLEEDEVGQQFETIVPIQLWISNSRLWEPSDGWHGWMKQNTYRTRLTRAKRGLEPEKVCWREDYRPVKHEPKFDDVKCSNCGRLYRDHIPRVPSNQELSTTKPECWRESPTPSFQPQSFEEWRATSNLPFNVSTSDAAREGWNARQPYISALEAEIAKLKKMLDE